MSENFNGSYDRGWDDSFFKHISNFVGETVTVYCNAGGLAGCGFTGILIKVTPCFIRLITSVGPAPSCAVGSDCNGCRCLNNKRCVSHVGSVADIPICSIVSFVHNAV